MDRTPMHRVAAASAIGTILEWYDFALYNAMAGLVFNKIFFPSFDPLVGTLLAFLTYGVGMVARPVGGVICGRLGDIIGRRPMLIATVSVMGGSTALIGLLPGYDKIGVVAPILLVVLRFVQGIMLGGEWAGPYSSPSSTDQPIGEASTRLGHNAERQEERCSRPPPSR